VTNGKEAIKALEKAPYDLVFMDAEIPDTDGYAVTRVIRDPQSGVRCHDVPVIAMTRDPEEQDRKRCIQAGMDHCIGKPIEPQKLREVIKMFPPLTYGDLSTE
jgi:two-component system sensor histidine kinase/response regulator